jgi:hypothetical protein
VIRPKWLREVHDLLQSEQFSSWFAEYRELRSAVAAVQSRRDELAADGALSEIRAELTQRAGDELVYEAGAREDLAARAAAECAVIENDSFELLSAYELRRSRARENQRELERRQGVVQQQRGQVAEARAALEAAKKADRGATEVDLLAARLEAAERDLEATLRDVELLVARAEQDKKRELGVWNEEESAWFAAFRANLARSEHAYEARRLRGRTEMPFAKAAEQRRHADELERRAKREAEELARTKALLEERLQTAENTFECARIGEFLFWPMQEDLGSAYCVPLIDEPTLFNVPASALRLYRVERARGLDHLEPIAEPA